MNDQWNVLYKVSVFYVDQKYKMAATTEHRFNTGPLWENIEIFYSFFDQRQTGMKMEKNAHNTSVN